jgi:hypothetical protein
MTVVPIAYDAQLFINGEFTDAASGKTLDIVNPATGAVIGRLADAGVLDVDRAVTAAQNAFDEGKWSGASIQKRARILNRFADLFEADPEAFYKLETLNNGRPIVETRAQISRLPQFYRYFAALALTRRSDVIPIEGPYLCYTQRVPLGVVALMTSFNHPLMILSKSLAPALATGNSVVIKPSEQTPLTTIRLVELLDRAGIPKGVVNVVNGAGSVAGEVEVPLEIGVASELVRSQIGVDTQQFRRGRVDLGLNFPGNAQNRLAFDVAVHAHRITELGDTDVTAGRIVIALPATLQPGLHSVQVTHPVDFETGLTSDPHRGIESNVAAFVLSPEITTPAPIAAARNTTLTLTIDPPVGRAQRATLLVGGGTISIPARPAAGPAATATLDFPIPNDFTTGTQLLRVQIDGAESPLEVDGSGQFVGPTVTIT